MGKIDLQCLFIGDSSGLYPEVIALLSGLGLNVNVKQTKAEKKSIIYALKKLRNTGILFISDEIPFSIRLLSDLIWQYSPDTIVVILTRKTESITFKKSLNNAQFSRLSFKNNTDSTQLFFEQLIQSALMKKELRRCKRLLGISEKKCQWLVDSSSQAVAYVSRDIHLYANYEYLKLFGISSNQELHSIPVEDFIVENDRPAFDKYIKRQLIHQKLDQSLVLSMRSQTQKELRSSIVAVPTVLKGKKCIQLWVRPLKKLGEEDESVRINTPDSSKLKTPTLEKSEFKPFQKKVEKVKPADPSKILREIIHRKEASIVAHKLTQMKVKHRRNYDSKQYYNLKLRVSEAQREGINDLLFRQSSSSNILQERDVFWDKVSLSRLLQILMKQESSNKKLFIALSEASLNSQFLDWIIPGLKRVGIKTNALVFMIPSQIDEPQRKEVLRVVKGLREYGCSIGLDNLSASKSEVRMLKHVHPKYIRLSLPWVRKIEGNDKREISLGRFIRQFESANIKVIAPCGFSQQMQKLFSLSGVSFCQETHI